MTAATGSKHIRNLTQETTVKEIEQKNVAVTPNSNNSSIVSFRFLLCAFVWCGSLLYSIYRAIKSSQVLYSSLSFDDFENGWKILNNRPKDISDYEWAVFAEIMLQFWPWMALHVVITNIIKHCQLKILYEFFVVSSLLFLYKIFGLYPTVLLLFQILLMYTVHLAKNKFLCWAASGLFVLFLNYGAGVLLQDLMDLSETREEYLLSVTISWTVCRCLSFCLLQCNANEENVNHKGLLHMLAYVLYIPLVITGPIVAYDDFQRDMCHRLSAKEFGWCLLNFIRYSFWFMFNHLIRHYAYLSALNYHPHLVNTLPSWSLFGLAMGLAHLFMLKYVVFYGMSSTLAAAEGFQAPTKPKCVARIHLYSDMWKYFDYGLYNFLKRFIYVPAVSGGLGKFFGGFLCFTFIYIWHGTSRNVFIWTILNFFGVSVENFAMEFTRSKLYYALVVSIVTTV
ncbi:hypothetical protein CHUAL_006590 [Chamberlinius hualienensis]